MRKNNQRIVPSQWKLMVEFMERNGDISQFNDVLNKEYNDQNWHELTKLLNKKENGAKKTVTKWRKTWTDLKTITKKKELRIKTGVYKRATMSDLEKRILKLIARKNVKNSRDESQTLDQSLSLKMENIETDSIPGDLSDIQDDDDTEETQEPEELNDSCESNMSPTMNLLKRRSSLRNSVNTEQKKAKRISQKQKSETLLNSTDPLDDPALHRRGSTSSSSTTSRRNKLGDTFSTLIQEYLKLDEEREKNLHKREMARIKQNQEVLKIASRLVNVLETLAPTIQKFVANVTEKR